MPGGLPQYMAMREDNVLRWLLGDHLGSTAITSNATSKIGKLRYRPRAGTRYSSGQTSLGFQTLAASASWLKPN